MIGNLEFVADLLAVAVDGSLRYSPYLGYLFSTHSVPDHVADGDLGGRHRLVGAR